MSETAEKSRKGKLTDKQRRVADHYLQCFNKTEAARRAGCSPISARNTGYEILEKPHVKAYIAEKLQGMVMGEEEVIKNINDIANSNLGDYFIFRQVEYTPRERVHISEVIKRVNNEILFERDFMEIAGFTPKEKIQQLQVIRHLERTLERLNLELKRNPKAHKIIPGETVLIDRPELDLAKVIKAGIKIKSAVPTEWGIKVETYSADAALVTLAKINGSFAKDNAQKNKPLPVMDAEQFATILKEARNAARKNNTSK